MTIDQAYCSRCGCALDEGRAVVAAQPHADSQFGMQLRSALRLWQAHLGELAVLSLVLLLVIWIPVLNLAFVAGYVRALGKLARHEGRPEVKELFQAWDCLGSLLVYVVLLGVATAILGWVPLLGPWAAAALGFVAYPGFYRIIDRSTSFEEAGPFEVGRWSLRAIQARPVAWLLSCLLGGCIAAVGSLLFFIGLTLTLPLGCLIAILQYENSRTRD